MQSKNSAVLVGQLTLLAIACLLTAFALILMAGGQWSYRCGVWLRAWINRYRNRTVVKSQSEIIPSENLNPIVSEPGSDFEPVPDPWELPLEPLPALKQLLLKAPTKSVLYLLPPAREPQYAAMTIRELKRIARDRQISNYGRMNKTQLIQSLQAA
ncbi:MAG: Rho termination factor N-terminal domain-containing protein [Leptolyngbyaceae cyanobacterium]